MIKLKLKRGDEFATANPMALGKIINFVQRADSVDNESIYSHAGFLTKAAGATLESLWTVKSQDLFEAYAGKRVLIVRNKRMDDNVYRCGYAKIEQHIGQLYPFPRLALHLIHMAKVIHWDRVVCSELVAKFESGCASYCQDKAGSDGYSFGFLRNWYGVTPDDLADRWRESKFYDVIFEGVLE